MQNNALRSAAVTRPSTPGQEVLAFAIWMFFHRCQMANGNRTMAMSESTAPVVSSFRNDNKLEILSCDYAEADGNLSSYGNEPYAIRAPRCAGGN